MLPYIVSKLASNSTHFTKKLVKYVPGMGYFRAAPSHNGDKFVTPSPPPPIVEQTDDRVVLKETREIGKGAIDEI